MAHEKIGVVQVEQNELRGALGEYDESFNILQRLAARAAIDRQAIEDIGGIAYYFILVRAFAKALDAANLAITAAPDLVWLYTNKAHALMFLGRAEDARKIYLAHRGKPTQGRKSWEVVVLVTSLNSTKMG